METKAYQKIPNNIALQNFRLKSFILSRKDSARSPGSHSDDPVISRGTPTVIPVSSWASSLSSSIKKTTVGMWPTIITLVSTFQTLKMVGIISMLQRQSEEYLSPQGWPGSAVTASWCGLWSQGEPRPATWGDDQVPGRAGAGHPASYSFLFRFLVLVLLANCIQNMLASCPLVCDIEDVLKVSMSWCENITP